MSRWWRAYSESMNDPKLMLLPADLFRSWYILLCVASDNDGRIPSAAHASLALRTSESKARETVAALAGRGLFDAVTGGYFEPHNWKRRQYKSDVSTDRVKRLRKRQRNDDETFHGTVRKRCIRDTEQNRTERKKTSSGGRGATRPAFDEHFSEFWRAYPKREGANPKAPALKAFIAACKAGADPQEVIAGVKRYAADPSTKTGTPYVPQAIKWLRDRRWEDHAAPASLASYRPPGAPSDEELRRKYADGQRVDGTTTAPVDASGAGPRPAKQQLGSHPTRIGGARSLGSVLQGIGMGAAGFQETADRRGMHDANPMAGLAARGVGANGNDAEEGEDFSIQVERPLQ